MQVLIVLAFLAAVSHTSAIPLDGEFHKTYTPIILQLVMCIQCAVEAYLLHQAPRLMTQVSGVGTFHELSLTVDVRRIYRCWNRR